MPKTITMTLSQSSIQNAIKEIRQYQSDLNRKCEEFCRRLTELGKITAESHIGESPLGKYITVTTDIKPEKAGCKAMLIATGSTKTQMWQTKDGVRKADFSTLLAVEFGAGIFYNSKQNPKAVELGFGVGTFPDQKHAFEDTWFWMDMDGVWHSSHGVKATMPMYNASTEMLLNIRKIAKEVFGS